MANLESMVSEDAKLKIKDFIPVVGAYGYYSRNIRFISQHWHFNTETIDHMANNQTFLEVYNILLGTAILAGGLYYLLH
mgnify:CR=1 FL=1